eukprot:364079-Chlamydomonas_euryale.AAC.2
MLRWLVGVNTPQPKASPCRMHRRTSGLPPGGMSEDESPPPAAAPPAAADIATCRRRGCARSDACACRCCACCSCCAGIDATPRVKTPGSATSHRRMARTPRAVGAAADVVPATGAHRAPQGRDRPECATAAAAAPPVTLPAAWSAHPPFLRGVRNAGIAATPTSGVRGARTALYRAIGAPAALDRPRGAGVARMSTDGGCQAAGAIGQMLQKLASQDRRGGGCQRNSVDRLPLGGPGPAAAGPPAVAARGRGHGRALRLT